MKRFIFCTEFILSAIEISIKGMPKRHIPFLIKIVTVLKFMLIVHLLFFSCLTEIVLVLKFAYIKKSFIIFFRA